MRIFRGYVIFSNDFNDLAKSNCESRLDKQFYNYNVYG